MAEVAAVQIAVDVVVVMTDHGHCYFPERDRRRLFVVWSDRSCLYKVSMKHVAVVCCSCSLSGSFLPFCFETKPVIQCVNFFLLVSQRMKNDIPVLLFLSCSIQWLGSL